MAAPNFRELVGIDRPSVINPATTPQSPWNIWTWPNAITILRLLGIPVFIVMALDADGPSTAAAILFAVISLTDYLDGLLARATGQYSRFGALVDPFVDRLLVVSGVVVAAAVGLLPWVLVILLLAREIFIIGWYRYLMVKEAQLPIHWYGRFGVAFAMTSPVAAFAGWHIIALICLIVGGALAYLATVVYVRDGIALVRSLSATDELPDHRQ